MNDNVVTNNLPVMISLEGIDGSGKSTMLGLVAEHLSNLGCRVGVFYYTSSHPGMVGKAIQSLYKSKRNSGWFINKIAQLRLLQEILYAIQAYLNLRDLGNLQKYDFILTDRCAVSAYVAHIDKPSRQKHRELLMDIIEMPFVPDYVIYLLVSLNTSLHRISGREYFLMDERLEKLLSMQSNYEKLISGEWSPKGLRKIKGWCTVNAEQDPNEVKKCISDLVNQICEGDIQKHQEVVTS